MGHTLHGQIYLYPEEALFLVDRGSLLAEHRGVDMTVQQMWSVYLQQAEERQQKEFAGAARAVDLYVTYAYLKRLGFVVTRPGTYHNAEEGTQSDTKAADQMQIVPSGSWTELWSTVAAMWRRKARSLFHALDLWFAPWSRLFSSGLDRPLVSNGDQLTYALEDFADYFQGQVDPATHESSDIVTTAAATSVPLPQATPGSGKGKKVKAPDWPKILFAVVDGGQVTFLNIFNIKASP
ncbi:hypothetical protein BGZ93_003961 [Podila epicladia]|nr:hypothetical protein BGZ93_003961 [Podila epicladia]